MSNVYTSNDQINSSETSTLVRDFKGIWIPKEIYLRRDINALEKFLWAEIDSLYEESKGGCYAKEEHLCEMLGVKRRQLYEMLKHLKDLGLIEDVSFNGREKVRKAINPKQLTSERAQQVCGKPHSTGAEKRTSTPYIYRDTNIDIKILSKESTKEAANAASPPPDKKISKKTFVSAAVQKKYVDQGKGIVKMDQDEWDKLVQEFGETQVATTATKLSEYMVSSGKIYKDHYLTIRNWIKRDLEKEKAKKPKRDFRDFPGNYTMKRDHEVEVF